MRNDIIVKKLIAYSDKVMDYCADLDYDLTVISRKHTLKFLCVISMVCAIGLCMITRE